jgi:hypothetical protein
VSDLVERLTDGAIEHLNRAGVAITFAAATDYTTFSRCLVAGGLRWLHHVLEHYELGGDELLETVELVNAFERALVDLDAELGRA